VPNMSNNTNNNNNNANLNNGAALESSSNNHPNNNNNMTSSSLPDHSTLHFNNTFQQLQPQPTSSMLQSHYDPSTSYLQQSQQYQQSMQQQQQQQGVTPSVPLSRQQQPPAPQLAPIGGDPSSMINVQYRETPQGM
jgi:hypothetical protein